MAQQNVRGVPVDSGARRINDPVTIVVWPARDGEKPMEQEADTWSDANNYVSAGASIKAGYPSEPEMVLNPDAVPPPGSDEQEPAGQATPPPPAPRPAPAVPPAS